MRVTPGERIKVTVQYGYYFNGTPETIPGGVFWTTDISFADNILTIVADCSLALMDGDEEFSFTPNNNDRTIWEGEQTEIMYYETDEFADGASFGHYLDKILLSTNVTIIASEHLKIYSLFRCQCQEKK